MVTNLVCPKCTNTCWSIIDIEIDGQILKGVQCNSCNEISWIYKDNSKEIEELIEMIESLERTVDDLESDISRIR